MPLNGGILIVGSFLWDESRERCRRSRLDMESAEPVTAPIRYGRQSETRGNTYAMVFSRGCDTGKATAVRCRHAASSPDDVISEAEHLWAAEQNAAVNRKVSANWGCVTLLCNPKRNIPQTFLTGWANRVAQIQNQGNIPQLTGEGRLVSDGGCCRLPGRDVWLTDRPFLWISYWLQRLGLP